MKKFTKLFLSCMAVSAITAAVATSAMAADINGGQITGSYDETTGKITASVAGAEADQSTILVLYGTDVVEQNIVYIDQQDKAEFEGGLMVAEDGAIRTEENAKGTYTVMIGYTPDGGEFTIAKGTFKLGGSDQLLGDADNSGVINVGDASAVLKHVAKIATLEGDNLLAADADDSGVVNVGDASTILKHVAKIDTSVLGTKTVSDKEKTEVR